MNKLFALFFLQLLVVNSFAQSESDVMRYSFGAPIGTARTTGMGGAFGAVGADLFSSVINPAGIGVYRKSEFVFSPGLYIPTTNTRMTRKTIRISIFLETRKDRKDPVGLSIL